MYIFNKNRDIINFIFPFLCILNPIYVHIRVHEVSQVSLIIVSFFALVCSIAGMMLVLNKNQKFNNILISFLIAINFDLYLNFSKSISYIVSLSRYQELIFDSLYFFFIFFTSFLLIRKSKLFFNFMFIFLFFSAVANIILPYQSPFNSFEEIQNTEKEINEKQKRIVVIMFDGFMGVEGIKRINSNKSIEFQNHVAKLNQLYDFSVFNKAYSRFTHTHYSMGHLLNYDFESLDNHKVYFDARKGTIIKNRFFSERSDFHIKVYQTDQINFCRNDNVLKCETFNPYKIEFLNDEGRLKKYIRHPIQNFNSAIQSSSFSKYVFTALVKILNKFNDVDLRMNPEYYARHFSKWFDMFVTDILDSEPGSLYFAHFMMPHEPYLLNENCVLHNLPNNSFKKIKKKDDFEFLQKLSEEQQKKRLIEYDKYFQQSKCVLNKIDDLIVSLKKGYKFDNTDIFIFGDHGTRISEGIFYETTSNEDLIDNHSAIFFAKTNEQKGNVLIEKVSIQKIFSYFFNKSFQNNKNRNLIDDGEVSMKSQIDGIYKSKKINF